MCTDVPVSLQLLEARTMGLDPTNWLRVMLELEYPLINRFNNDHEAVVDLFHSRFPNAPIPFVGPAAFDINYSGPLFDNQDAWCEMELSNQRSRFSLTDDRDFELKGPGLPFERLYFEARAQLRRATNELLSLRRRNALASQDEFLRSGRPISSP